MSKESIPIGSLCSECAQYSGCARLCRYAEQYWGKGVAFILAMEHAKQCVSE